MVVKNYFILKNVLCYESGPRILYPSNHLATAQQLHGNNLELCLVMFAQANVTYILLENLIFCCLEWCNPERW